MTRNQIHAISEILCKESDKFHLFTEHNRFQAAGFSEDLHETFSLEWALKKLGEQWGFRFFEQNLNKEQILKEEEDISLPLIIALSSNTKTQIFLFFPEKDQEKKYYLVNDSGSNKWIHLDEFCTKVNNFETEFPDFVLSVLSVMNYEPLLSNEDSHLHLSPWNRLWRLFKKEKKVVFYVYWYAAISGILSLSLPLGIQAIVGYISGGVIFQSATLLILFVLLGVVLSGVLQLMQISLVELLQRRIFTRIALEFADKIPRIQPGVARRMNLPEQVNRFFDTLTLMKGMPKLLLDVSSNGLTLLFGLLLLSLYHAFFVFYGLVVLLLLVVLFRFLTPAGLQSSLKESKEKYFTQSWLEELARNFHVLRRKPNSRLVDEKTDHYITRYLMARKKHFSILMAHYIGLLVFKVLILGGLLIMGAQMVVSREISLGQFIASEVIIILIMGAVEKLIQTLDIAYDSVTACDKLGHFTDLPSENTPLYHVERSLEDILEVEALSMGPVKNWNIRFERGCLYNFSGLENSESLQLITVLDGTSSSEKGKVKWGGINIREQNQHWIATKICSCIGKDLLETSILENIGLGVVRPDSDIFHLSIEKVGLYNCLDRLGLSLETLINPNDIYLSTELKTRIVLARLLVQQADYYLINDLFSDCKPEIQKEFFAILRESGKTWVQFSAKCSDMSKDIIKYEIGQKGEFALTQSGSNKNNE